MTLAVGYQKVPEARRRSWPWDEDELSDHLWRDPSTCSISFSQGPQNNASDIQVHRCQKSMGVGEERVCYMIPQQINL